MPNRSVSTIVIPPPAGKDGDEKQMTGTSKMPSLQTLDLPAVLKSVLDNVGIALAVIDSEHRFVYTNQAAFKMFGVTENLPFAEWRRDYKLQDSQGREIPAARTPLLRALAGEEVKPQDVRMTLPDGSAKWLHGAGHRFSTFWPQRSVRHRC